MKVFSGANIRDIYDNIKPILRHNSEYLILHVDTNDALKLPSNEILDKVLELNDTHREKFALDWIHHKNSLKYKVGCLWRFSYICTINYVLLIPLSYRCLKNVIHQIDSKNEWLFLSVIFTSKFELVFVLTFENAFF